MTLPQSLTIAGTTHVVCYKDDNFVITQNYSQTTSPSDQPIISPGGVITGTNMFHLFRIVRSPNETLGDKLGTFTDLHAAMTFAAKQEGLA